MTITCDTKPSPRRATTELQFGFYRNGINDSGNYTCEVQTVTGSVRKRSSEIYIQFMLFTVPRINVKPDLMEGDHMTITCDTKPSPRGATTELQFGFYRNGTNVQGFNSSNQYRVPSAQLEDSGNYTCEVQTVTGSVRKRSDVTRVQIQELFTVPRINVKPDLMEGDHMTITCDTKPSPRGATTELQFGFYRNGTNVQGFNSSNQYRVPSAQLEDSGNYTCEVQTVTGSVRKRSDVTRVQIQEMGESIDGDQKNLLIRGANETHSGNYQVGPVILKK
ncbi:hypothetical protein GDO86_016656 [Hymenochirus boettgeri]|uniref:Ig-like domain-containing protein n=1 Tax=Hymenochirus boettgeri TaxID=247094 RepID=A0A8T2JXW7_9PIPI|nr:hypothetical protein GDO86_016656 [Hymenochirus boettgeri]